MSNKRQKNRNQPASQARVGSETSDGAMRGFELLAAVCATENLALTERQWNSAAVKQLNPPNRRVRTRMHGGVAGRSPRGLPLCRSFPFALPIWLRLPNGALYKPPVAFAKVPNLVHNEV